MSAARAEDTRRPGRAARAGAALGPLVIGVAVWCAAGTIAVATPDSATQRLAVAAPWWMFVLGTVMGAAVPAWRARPLTVLPALLAIVPWLPLPLPAVALIWTGPMAWVPIIAALAFALGLAPLGNVARLFNLLEPDDATVAAFVLAAMLGGLAAWSADPRTPGGDEPHYLMIAQSLLKDGDLDLTNNHLHRDYASFYGGELQLDSRRRGLHGEGYSIHAPGVAVLVAPLFQFFGYTGARVVLILLTSIGAMLTWRLSWRVTDSAAAAWCAWGAVILTPTFAMQSFMVFPDAPGFLIVAAATLLLVQLSRGDLPGTLPVFLTGIALAALPWLHTRFAILAGGFGAVIVMRLVAPGVIPPRRRSDLAAELAPDPVITRDDRVIRLIALLLVPAISAALWFWFFKAHYGTFDPRAPYGAEEQRLAWIIPAIMGLFFDGQYGLAAYAPAVALAFVGWWRRTETFTRRLAVELAVIVCAYLAAVTTVRMWWAGNPATPARFMMAVLPLLAVPIAAAWTRVTTATRALAVAMIAIGGGVTAVVLSVDRANLAWNYRWEQPAWLEWLSPVVNLSRAWPGFFWQESRFPVHVMLWCAIGAVVWLIARRVVADARAAVVVWGLAALSLLAPAGWALTRAAALDPAAAQLRVIASEGAGDRVYAIGAGRFARVRSLKDTMVLRPLEPGPDPGRQPPLLAFPDVPAARYVVRVTSTGAAPVPLRLFVGGSRSPWREFAVPGAGVFSFPFVLPVAVPRVVIDADQAARATLRVELIVEEAMPAREAVVTRSAAHYGSSDVLFLDDQVFAEPDGFWVRGRQAARFLLVPAVTGPVSPLTARILVRNGGAPNTVTVESGTFQRLLMMTPFQELDVDVPLTPAGTANVRVASGDGFVPADLQPGSTDRRLLCVWIQPG